MCQVAKFVSRFRDRAIASGKVEGRGVSVDVSDSGSHLGEASVRDENERACEVFGWMDYVVEGRSKDCRAVDR